MKNGFSLVELVIVVALLGIMAAIIVPQFQNQSTNAKEAVAKEGLRILRGAIELYTAQHSGIPPGYTNDDPQNYPVPTSSNFYDQLTVDNRYMSKMPTNPFNYQQDINMVGNGELFPSNATGDFGWVYQAATKTIRLDWEGTDKYGVRYFDY
jgi:prepilin-type N-terminal cleavage/methylation domain-containing protein